MLAVTKYSCKLEGFIHQPDKLTKVILHLLLGIKYKISVECYYLKRVKDMSMF